jgi:hypothetical protein
MPKLPSGPPVRLNPSGLGSTQLAWSGPLGRPHFPSLSLANPNPWALATHVAAVFFDLFRPSPAVAAGEVWRIWTAIRWRFRSTAAIRAALLARFAPNASATRPWRFQATHRPPMIQTPRRDVAVCLAVVVLGRLRPATPGLAAAWRCRVRLVPPCRHGHAAVLCSRCVCLLLSCLLYLLFFLWLPWPLPCCASCYCLHAYAAMCYCYLCVLACAALLDYQCRLLCFLTTSVHAMSLLWPSCNCSWASIDVHGLLACSSYDYDH